MVERNRKAAIPRLLLQNGDDQTNDKQLVVYQGTRLPDYPRVPGHFSTTRNRLLRFSYYPEPTRTRV